MSDVPVSKDPQTLLRWIRLKAAEFVVQVLVVIFSIVLALAVDEWRDTKAQRELVRQVQTSIVDELKANNKELSESIALNDSVLTVLVREFKSNKPRKEGFSFSYAQLSSAAWQTAQGVKSLHLLNFPYLIKIAKVYEFQTLYNVNQSKLVGSIGDSWIGGNEKDLLNAQKRLAVQIATVSQLGHGLSAQYLEVVNDTTNLIGK
jgi:hypothetical protein